MDQTTASGPRRLNVDADVSASLRNNRDGYQLYIHLHTVGTGQFVGCATLHALVLDGKKLMTYKQLQALDKRYPTRRMATMDELKAVANTLTSLERSIWAKQPEKSEPLEADETSLQHDSSSPAPDDAVDQRIQ